MTKVASDSYAESVRQVVIEQRIEVASLERLKELTLLQRQKKNLIVETDMNEIPGSRKRWDSRVRAALRQLRKSGECALIERAKYRFFI